MGSGSPRTFPVEVEEALGPGLEYAHDLDRGIYLTGVRQGGLWLGVDRGFLVDSDDGRGRRVPVLVALPSSSFPGARIEVELTGGFGGPRDVLVGRAADVSVPIEPFLRTAGRLDGDARWVGATRAAAIATAARRAYRERKGRGRITGGRAWQPPQERSSLLASSAFYSSAERSLDTLPPRYRRALDGLLDSGERIHYSVRRPWRLDSGLADRLRRGDRRSGLLLLTDREILWLVDHSNPDSYLSDWGVDVELLPIESLRRLSVESRRGEVRLAFEGGGQLHVALPFELEAEGHAVATLAERFLPERNTSRLRRRYQTEPIAFAEETAARFGRLEEGLEMLEAARREAGQVKAFLFSPRREGQRRSLGLWLAPDAIGLLGPKPARIPLASLTGVRMSLSPLSAAIAIRSAAGTIGFPYPGSLTVHGAAFVKLLRSMWANVSGGG
jgi:hypothetical protein